MITSVLIFNLRSVTSFKKTKLAIEMLTDKQEHLWIKIEIIAKSQMMCSLFFIVVLLQLSQSPPIALP